MDIVTRLRGGRTGGRRAGSEFIDRAEPGRVRPWLPDRWPTSAACRCGPGFAASQASIASDARQHPADLVGAGEEHLAREGVDLERDVLVARQVDGSGLSRSTVTWPSGSSATWSKSWRCVSSSTTMGSRPFFSALLRKMSAKLVERIARMPHEVSAHGACSRDEPHPKLSPASRTWRPCISGWLRMKSGLGVPSAS